MKEFYDWEDIITADDEEFVTLLPGKYTGEIAAIERKTWDGAGQMNGCRYADITVRIQTDGGVALVHDKLFLARATEFRVANFLSAFGLKTKGEPVKPSAIFKALKQTCMVTIKCEGGKEDDYRTLDLDTVKAYMAQGKDVYNKVKRYEAIHQIDTDEFGF